VSCCDGVFKVQDSQGTGKFLCHRAGVQGLQAGVCQEVPQFRGSSGSNAGRDDASTPTFSDSIIEILHRIEDDVAELKEAKCHVELMGADLRQTTDSILQRVRSIDEALDGMRHRTFLQGASPRAVLRFHPLTDLNGAEDVGAVCCTPSAVRRSWRSATNHISAIGKRRDTPEPMSNIQLYKFMHPHADIPTAIVKTSIACN
jgi:hypothetical protein